MVLNGVNRTTALVKEYFPDVPVFPSIGNHDNYLADQLPPPPEGQKWLAKLGNLWQPWLAAGADGRQAMKTFLFGGYYTKLSPIKGVRIVSVNTIYCDILNMWAMFDEHNKDIASQFAWLNKTLLDARRSGERVHIIGHIFFGVQDTNPTPQMFPWCNAAFTQLYLDFSDVILNSFFAHEHTDSFRILRTHSGKPKTAAGIFLTPSLTTFVNHNPSVRLFELGPSGLVLNYRQWFTDMVWDNVHGKIKWHFGYDGSAMYGLKDWSAESMGELFDKISTNATLFDTFLTWSNNRAVPVSCTGSCRRGRLCCIGNPDSPAYNKCMMP
jgi:Acid sphingomyelin phosphodiesterase C-terminal region